MTLFTLVLTLNIFIHDMNLDTATQQVVANRFNTKESSRRAPSANLHPHAEETQLKAVDPREKRRRRSFKNHQHLKKKRTQEPTPPTSVALAY